MPERDLIAARILQKRYAESKLQTEFANELGISEKTLRKLEKTNANIRLKRLKGIAVHMRMSLPTFLSPDFTAGTDLALNYENVEPQDISAEIATISAWFKMFLSLSGETQQEFSYHCGVCIDTANRIIRQLPSCNPTLNTLEKFAAYMVITLSELLDTTVTEAEMKKILEERLSL